MKKILRLTLAFTLYVFSTSNLYAVRAIPYPVTITQPDGSQLIIRLQGDERFHYKTTLDGYTLTPDNNNVLTYARLDVNGNLVSTSVKASNIEKRSSTEKILLKTLSQNIILNAKNRINSSVRSSVIKSSVSGIQKSYPLTGSPKSLVILVNFSDRSFVTASPQTAFTNLLNQKNYSVNGGTGSAKDYFRDNSMGVFNPQFDVVGTFTLPQTMDYYGKNDSNDEDTNPQQMVIDACTLASAAGVDFSQYDTDGNGIVDNIFIYYAGYNEAEGGTANSIWPHRWTLNNYNTKFNGVSVYGYACTSELKGSSGSNMCGIGTFCHEFGHVLGLDDMYATVSTATQHTLSSWDIMDYGPYLNNGRTPSGYSSYERFFLNWLVPTELKSPKNVTLDTLSTSNRAYLISQNGNHNLNGANPVPVEFFMLENRQLKGWDSYLPGHGMLVTHIYYNSTTWANNTPNNDPNAMGVDIIEADNIASDNTMSGDPFPGTSNLTTYSPTLRSGTNIGKPLTVIKETNGIITFKFMGGSSAATINTIGTLASFKTIQGTPSAIQTIKVSGIKLKSSIQLSFVTNLHYEMKKESDIAWGKTITLTPVDSTVTSTNIQIRYNPTVPSFANTHNETLQLNSTSAETISLSLAGTSTRRVYVVPPIARNATDTTIASFVAHWDAVSDSIEKFASGYYLTVYNTSEGTSKLKQGFNNGLVAPDWTINATALSPSAAFSGDSVPAIEFKNTGDFIQTEKYVLPATGLSFYVRSLSGNGYLFVEAWNDTKWTKLDSILVNSSLNTTKSYSFGEDKNYSRFKISYTRVSDYYVIIDDVTASFSQKLEYNFKDKWVSSTSDSLINLVSNRDYYYKVKASDKKLNSDGSILYENITNFSNLIHVKTIEDKAGKKALIVTVDKNHNLIVYSTSTEYPIRIYNVVGQLIRIVSQTYNETTIKGLPHNQVYIIQSGARSSKVVL